MAKILIELSTGIGPLIRCLPTAIWLRDEGHDVRYFARDNAGRHLRAFGFRPIDIDPARVAYHRVVLPGWRDVDEVWGHWGFHDRQWLRDRIEVWKAALSALRPDVVLTDFGILSSITARLLDLPLAAITQSCMHVGVYGGKQSFWIDGHRPQHASRDCVNGIFEEHGSSVRVGTFEELFQGDRTIIPSIPELDVLEPGKAGDTRFVGPILWDGLSPGSGPGPQWPLSRRTRPAVFVYTGRMRDGNGNSGELVLRAVLDCARSQDFQFVISTGGMDEVPPGIDLDLPNVTLVDWLPMETAYANSDLVIHHGGHGSCLGGLKYGVPALIVPTHTEREYNARLMKRMGCADFLGKDEVTGPLLTARALGLLADATVTRELARYRRLIATQYDRGVELAGQAILSLLPASS